MALLRVRYRWLLVLAFFLVLDSIPRVSSAKSFSAHRALPQAESWFNTSRPLTADDLRGRLLLVDFWTYACVNCLHVLPDLKVLETEFGHELTVIGVHSAKFSSEKENDSIRDAVLRLGIEHPVANDRDFKIWNQFEVTAWPTLVLVDPSGGILKKFSGEGHLPDIRAAISEYYAKHPKPAEPVALTPLPVALEKAKEKSGGLRFPGKVIWANHEGRPHLFIADSGHQRVLGVALEGPNLGKLRFIVGKENEGGNADGDFEAARFQSPQGLAYEAGVLYVADRGNHTLRAIDFRKRAVTTIAGTGQPGNVREAAEAPALGTALSSPWDVAVWKRQVVIAMAGIHQLWAYDRDKKTLSVVAGNGAESIDDGAYPDNTLAQPSGLSVLGDKLYFVDAETSSLRVLENGRVSTVVGTGLFDFGFRDGISGRALLQHPLGVHAEKDAVYVADTFNHAIRRFNLETGRMETLGGNGKRGVANSGALAQATFAEPAGIGGTRGVLYVADTNNGVVRVIDLKDKRIETLLLDDSASTERTITAVRQLETSLPRLQTASPGEVSSQKTVSVFIELEPGWKLNPAGPSWLALFSVDDKGAALVKEFGRRDLQRARVKLPPLVDGANYRLQGTFYFCESRRNSLCVLRSYDQTLKADPTKDVRELAIALQR